MEVGRSQAGGQNIQMQDSDSFKRAKTVLEGA